MRSSCHLLNKCIGNPKLPRERREEIAFQSWRGSWALIATQLLSDLGARSYGIHMFSHSKDRTVMPNFFSKKCFENYWWKRQYKSKMFIIITIIWKQTWSLKIYLFLSRNFKFLLSTAKSMPRGVFLVYWGRVGIRGFKIRHFPQ